jgi:hypothetical protein
MTDASEKTVNRSYEAAIVALLRRTLGSALERLEPVPTYPDSIVYRAEAGGRRVLFKAMDPQGRDPDGIGLEAWALERAAARGDPVWEFVDYGPGVPDILEGYAPDPSLRAQFDDAFALYQLLRTIPWAARWHARGASHVVDWLEVTLRRAVAHFG